MFRSTRRPVIYPQAVHGRLAAQIATAWGNGPFERPQMPFPSFVRGVALHDRGYGELDNDGVGEVPPERWIEIQERGFRPAKDDPVVDLIVALHVHRLVSKPGDPIEAAALPAMDAALPSLYAAAGVREADGKMANTITHLCDRISLTICFEERDTWVQGVIPRSEMPPLDVSVTFDGEEVATMDPWPLAVDALPTLIGGFHSEHYPQRLDPVITLIRLQPA